MVFHSVFRWFPNVAGFGNRRNLDLYISGSELAAQAPGSRGMRGAWPAIPIVSGSDYLWGSYFCFSFVAALRLSLSLRLAWLGFLPPWVGAPFGAPCGPPFGLWAPVLVRGYTGIFCPFTAASPSLFLPPGLAEPKLVWLKPLVGQLSCRALVVRKTQWS